MKIRVRGHPQLQSTSCARLGSMGPYIRKEELEGGREKRKRGRGREGRRGNEHTHTHKTPYNPSMQAPQAEGQRG